MEMRLCGSPPVLAQRLCAASALLTKFGLKNRIRALQSVDLTARRLTGRHQISEDGKHLIDGVPFGKPYLRRSVSSRPAITIPPRKRRRVTSEGWDTEVGAEDNDEDWEWDEHENGADEKWLALMGEPNAQGSNA